MRLTIYKPDTIGAVTSALCLLHCIATPLLFIINTGSKSVPTLWQWADYFFLAVSFLAVYRSTQTSSAGFIKAALWISWIALFVVIINEKLSWLSLPEFMIYIVATALIALHIYNLKYCQCETDTCCTNHE